MKSSTAEAIREAILADAIPIRNNRESDHDDLIRHVAFVGWLRAYNYGVGDSAVSVGFYGLDLYGIHASIVAVLGHRRFQLLRFSPAEQAETCIVL